MPMESVPDDRNRELMLDGNAVAGELREMFSVEVTTGEGECAGCGKTHAMGALLAFTHGPGIVLRCPRRLSRCARDRGHADRLAGLARSREIAGRWMCCRRHMSHSPHPVPKSPNAEHSLGLP
jgi:Family of unknown function (DUF6510)